MSTILEEPESDSHVGGAPGLGTVSQGTSSQRTARPDIMSRDAVPGALAALPPKTVNRNWSDQPAESLHCEWIDDLSSLEALVPQWKRLVELSIDPNVFYEPELLLPALRWLGRFPASRDAAVGTSAGRGSRSARHAATGPVRVAVVSAQQRATTTAPRVLCGLFPLELRRAFHGVPARTARLWKHAQCFLTTPLIRADCVAETWRALIEFLQRGTPAVSLIDLPLVPAEGPFHHELVEFLHEDGRRPFWVKGIERRAMFHRRATAEEFLAHWKGKRRQETARQLRRLEKEGELRIHEFQRADDVALWVERFLSLEAAGWKGNAGTALACSSADREFILAAAGQLADENRLAMHALELDGRPIAMKVTFLTRPGGFAFKIAYDERFEKYSPGWVLEKIHLEQLHQPGQPIWLDSCAEPGHPMIDYVWPDRRLLQSLVLPTNRPGARLALAALPLARWGFHQFRSKSRPGDTKR